MASIHVLCMIFEVYEGSWAVLGGPFGVGGQGKAGEVWRGPREVPGGPGVALGMLYFLFR